MESQSSPTSLRIVGVLVIAAALANLLLQLHGISIFTPAALAPPLATALLFIGVAAILFGLAATIDQRSKGPSEMIRGLNTAQAQLNELSTKVDELGLSVDRLARTRSPGPIVSTPDHGPSPTTDLSQVQTLLEELREMALLTDDQRRERGQRLAAERKVAQVQRAITFIDRRQWAEAEPAVASLEAEFAGDNTIAQARKRLEETRSIAEAESIVAIESEIESEMSLGHWDQALSLARTLAGDFPTSSKAATLLARVQREKSIYVETSVQRLFDDIRHDIERRIWRRALAHAQKLLEKFPEHPKSERIRQQLKTIQDNAEIEERQEQEVRIGELIRARRFPEAIQLGEDLLHRFPISPQAEAIEKMLPRIRHLAAEADRTPSA